ncbi:D-glycero-beta-D-manno-heptose 1-phosphate adenylyltransferase [Allostreptomyces psammosilenae]|uniref:D-glycero-beta-D-manno-heptose 1-phosphate adenylyltransferase n=1 Tax=Allostreptomyces psammosilenae TaxID=1892865 RepID=A0A852ZZV7_9ACTN|nr:D-glycero-beta-D-manno-heptose 1-phosphate adenylyltransferase [Allostreptomyces psammosilenae]NYI04111.1 rfaE bifunctional protein nucleotidyltransferase chain/domain [Allostreptomyces psammosilenae]
MTARRPLVVVGDLLLDRDLDGTATRLCPDAPAPVVDDPAETLRPGGAGLAALLAARDGHDVVLVTPLSDDPRGRRAHALLRPHLRVVPLPADGPPAEKTRIRAGGQTLLRLDRAGGRPTGEVPDEAVRAVRTAGALLVADYGRGATALPALRRALGERAGAVPLVWDPHPRGSEPVPGTSVVTPNQAEALDFAARPTAAGSAAAPAAPGPGTLVHRMTALAHALRERWSADAVCVTLGARGALLARAAGSTCAVPAPDVLAPDPCGAGDRFAATLALRLGGGALPAEAVEDAVASAARFLAAGGAAAVHARPAAAPPAESVAPGRAASGTALPPAAAAVRARGGTVVATGGCYDLLHAGHVATLRAARSLGDCLVVLLNSDASVRALKGPGRPLNDQHDRAAVLAALDCVDAVVVFEETTPERALRALRPDVWVKGGDYSGADLPETPLVESWGGRVLTVPFLSGRSTTSLAQAAAESLRAARDARDAREARDGAGLPAGGTPARPSGRAWPR